MTVLFVTGGTGGHVFPALAMAEKIKDEKVLFLTDERGARYFPEGAEKVILPAWSFKKPGSILRVLCMVKKTLKEKDITSAWGFGGKMTLLPLLLCWMKRIPFNLHQSDTVMGRVNRLLTPLAQKVTHGFPLKKGLSKKHVYTGIPVRLSIKASPYKPHTKAFNLLVMGGSQGAAVFNEVIPKAVRSLSAVHQGMLQVTHQGHPDTLEEAQEAYAKTAAHVTVTPFIENVGEALEKSHLVISRAGSSTIGEILKVGRPSFLIPYPFAMDDHQTQNAQCLYAAGACFYQDQKAVTPEMLTAFLETCLNHTANLGHVARQARALIL